MSRERFPIQDGPSVPWDFMVPHEAQCRINHGHTASIEHIAGRGGFGAAEAWCVVNGLKFYDALPDQKAIDEARQKWFELAERVNREWSIKRLLAAERKPMECGHPKACYFAFEHVDEGTGEHLGTEEGCSACVERERVREMCVRRLGEMGGGYNTWQQVIVEAQEVLRQLDLTKSLAPSTEEGK